MGNGTDFSVHSETQGYKGEGRDGSCTESHLYTSHQIPTPPAEFALSSRACLRVGSILLWGMLQQSLGQVLKSVHSVEFWEFWKARASEASPHSPGKRGSFNCMRSKGALKAWGHLGISRFLNVHIVSIRFLLLCKKLRQIWGLKTVPMCYLTVLSVQILGKLS